MSLTNEDVQQIGGLLDQKLDEKIKGGLVQFWDEVLEPRFDGMDKRLDGMDKRLERVEAKVDNLEGTLKTQYPDKTYLDNKLADAVSDIVQRIMKRDEKDRNFKLSLLELLKKQSVLSPQDVEALKLLVG